MQIKTTMTYHYIPIRIATIHTDTQTWQMDITSQEGDSEENDETPITQVSHTAGGLFTIRATREAQSDTTMHLLEWLQNTHTHMHACSVAQSCLFLCDPMDCGLPGSSAHGILQARILEWVIMPSSGNFPDPGNEPASLMSSTLAGRFLTTGTIWESPHIYTYRHKHNNLQYQWGFEQLTPVCH